MSKEPKPLLASSGRIKHRFLYRTDTKNLKQQQQKFYFTPEFTLQCCRTNTKMMGVLPIRNNLRVKNARQPVKRKYILHVKVRDTKQTIRQEDV